MHRARVACGVAASLLLTHCGSEVTVRDLRRDGGGAGPSNACGPLAGQVQVLAEDQQGPHYLALDATHIYWAESSIYGDALVRAPKAGGEIDRLAPGAGTYGIAVDETHVFWVEYGDLGVSLYRMPKSGDVPEPLVQDTERATDVALDEEHIYWLDTGSLQAGYVDGRVRRVRKDGTDPAALSVGLVYVNSLAIDASSVYFAADHDLRRVSASGGATSVLFAPTPTQGEIRAVAVDGDALYFALTPLSALGTSSLWRANLDGSDVHPIVTDGPPVIDIALDDECVYFVATFGVARVPKDGGSPVTLASTTEPPADIVVDDEGVYWSEYGAGRVLRVAK